jgi:hypothetical protein
MNSATVRSKAKSTADFLGSQIFIDSLGVKPNNYALLSSSPKHRITVGKPAQSNSFRVKTQNMNASVGFDRTDCMSKSSGHKK